VRSLSREAPVPSVEEWVVKIRCDPRTSDEDDVSDGRQPSVCSVTFADRDNKSPQQPVYRVDWYRCRLPSLVNGV